MDSSQFLIVALAHLLAVMSPGPDFAIVIRQSVVSGRISGLKTSFGIALGILVHVAYSLVGIGLVISQSIILFRTIQYLGAAYLIFIGIKALMSKKGSATTNIEDVSVKKIKNEITVGFLTNALNPKATLFFLALFSVVISPKTPLLIQAGYGAWMFFATFAWFALVTTFFSNNTVRNQFLRIGHWFDRAMGAALVGLGIKLALIEKDN